MMRGMPSLPDNATKKERIIDKTLVGLCLAWAMSPVIAAFTIIYVTSEDYQRDLKERELNKVRNQVVATGKIENYDYLGRDCPHTIRGYDRNLDGVIDDIKFHPGCNSFSTNDRIYNEGNKGFQFYLDYLK